MPAPGRTQESTLVLERPTDEILAVDEALTRLAGADPLAADLGKTPYFMGMSLPEAARHWDFTADGGPALGLCSQPPAPGVGHDQAR